MAEPIEDVIGDLSRVTGVRGALVVDAEAGVPVVAELTEALDEGALAALAAALFRRATEGTRMAGFGGVESVQLEAQEGHLLVAGAGPLLVAALVEPQAQLGMVRLQAGRAALRLT